LSYKEAKNIRDMKHALERCMQIFSWKIRREETTWKI